MTACQDKLLLLHGLVDGELDAANSLAIEAHLKACPGCSEELTRIETVRATLAGAQLGHRAPDGLRDRIGQQLDAAVPSASPAARRPIDVTPSPARPSGGAAAIGFNGRWASGGALVGIAASMALVFAMPQLTTTGMQDQLVASHVRSLLAHHLVDVETSNRHVVKPWFNGKIDFAPPVIDLVDRGYPLAGGRLDYIDGRVVAAIVYHRRLHSINLFVRPAGGLASPVGFTSRHDGYSIVRWTRGGLEFWAVSDIEPNELDQFRDIFESRTDN
jgi:anti-sigma factor RsiW